MSEEQNIEDQSTDNDQLPSQPVSKSEIENQKSEIENMEVHKHPHHITHKKKWTEYLLEFFMLFLAVFLGFLAENLREHSVEHQREQEFMQSFVRDLERDTAILNASFPLKEERVQAIDSIFDFFEKNNRAVEVPGAVHNNMRRALWDRHIRRNTGTIDQLKNSGSLRLIRKRNVVDSIAAYDMQWARLEYWREAYTDNQRHGSEMVEKMLNAIELLPIYKKDRSGSTTNLFNDAPSAKLNTAYLNEYLNFLFHQKFNTIQDERNYKNVEQSTEKLIALIQKEYHLKNE